VFHLNVADDYAYKIAARQIITISLLKHFEGVELWLFEQCTFKVPRLHLQSNRERALRGAKERSEFKTASEQGFKRFVTYDKHSTRQFLVVYISISEKGLTGDANLESIYRFQQA
jgi:hypothetical protein